MAVALTALFVALSGTAIALPGKNRVDKNDLKRGSVGSRAIANNSIRSSDIRRSNVLSSDIKDNAVTGNDVDEGSLGTVPSAANAATAGNASALGAVGPGGYQRTGAPRFFAATLQSGFQRYSPGGVDQSPPGYWIDGEGTTHLQGALTLGSSANTAFTLPVGFRPLTQRRLAIACAAGAGDLVVRTDGQVVVNNQGSPAPGSNCVGTGQAYLDGTEFRRDN